MFDEPRTQGSDRSGALTRSKSEGTQRVGAFSMLPMLIRRLGADPLAAMADGGLARTALDHAENRISYAALGRLLYESAALTRCAHFGLLAGRMWHLSDLGIVGEVMRNAPTVGQALRKLVFYQHLNSDAAAPFIREAANVADLGCAIYGGEVQGVEQLCDAYLAAAVNVMRELCGPAWAPTEVFLPHATPADSAPYRQCFRVYPRFNAEFCALRFPTHWLDRPVLGADPERLRTAERRARARPGPPLLRQVHRALRILLLSGNSSGDDVAAMLSMHRRTLNRRLKTEGATFQSALDHVRFGVARQLLGASDISLDEVAAALGYAGVSPFMRSFRRWAGTTPGRWRRMARRGEPVGVPPASPCLESHVRV